jgi:hypothetical protein
MAALCLAAVACAQIGDKAGEPQMQLVPDSLIPPSPALTPQEQLKTFQIAKGYQISLAASDPQVGDPVAAQFGPDGRLWVVEMQGYMPNLDGTTEDQPHGRVVVLEDKDGDGVADPLDACVDQAGVASPDPKANGCQRSGDKDGDGIADGIDACPDKAGVASADAKTHGCPLLDTDGDGVTDASDACAETAGVASADAKTNGCPAPSDGAR